MIKLDTSPTSLGFNVWNMEGWNYQESTDLGESDETNVSSLSFLLDDFMNSQMNQILEISILPRLGDNFKK